MSQALEVDAQNPPKPNPLKEIVQPFIDLVRAPRALWGVNVGYLLEGMVYFGLLTYLSFYFSDNVGLSDTHASWMVGTLTFGITLSMAFLGSVPDAIGVRRSMLIAFVVLLAGRFLLALGPSLGLPGGSLVSPLNGVALLAIIVVVVGYGMYQPAAYAAVRQFTSEKNSAMSYAMLYALMNLGGWLPTFFPPLRARVGISGMFWVMVGFNALALVVTAVLLSRRTVEQAIATAKAERENEGSAKPAAEKPAEAKQPFSMMRWLREHPLADMKFTFFIFALIPVQTLFAHNWLTLPKYVARAYAGTWVGDNFEAAVNFNPLLIFLLVPVVTALTQKAKVYRMMILGTAVMSLPTFLLALGTSQWLLLGFLVFTSLGEAMWQPRFLQYAAEIAPEGKTGIYMGIAQFPWFLTKMIVPLYAGAMLQRYVPDKGDMHPESMWLIHAFIAIASTVLLILARNWLGKDFKTKAA